MAPPPHAGEVVWGVHERVLSTWRQNDVDVGGAGKLRGRRPGTPNPRNPPNPPRTPRNPPEPPPEPPRNPPRNPPGTPPRTPPEPRNPPRPPGGARGGSSPAKRGRPGGGSTSASYPHVRQSDVDVGTRADSGGAAPGTPRGGSAGSGVGGDDLATVGLNATGGGRERGGEVVSAAGAVRPPTVGFGGFGSSHVLATAWRSWASWLRSVSHAAASELHGGSRPTAYAAVTTPPPRSRTAGVGSVATVAGGECGDHEPDPLDP